MRYITVVHKMMVYIIVHPMYIFHFIHIPLVVLLTAEQSLLFTIQCSETWVKGIWVKSQFLGNLSVTLNDPQCNEFTGNNDTHVWVQTNFTQCGCIATENDEVITLSNTATLTVTSSFGGNMVAREGYYDFAMICEISKVRRLISKYSNNRNTTNASGGDAFPPISSPSNITADDFTADIQFYTNHHYVEQAFFPIAVSTEEMLYVGISEQTGKLKYKFTVPQCSLKPLTNDVSVFTLLYQGCVVNTEDMRILSSNQSSFRFSLVTGKVISIAHSVVLKCHLYICHYHDTSPGCKQHCTHDPLPPNPPINPLHGVAPPPHNHPDHPPSSVGPLGEVVVTGPAVTFERKITCKEKTCGSNATCVDLFPAVCRCNHGFIRYLVTQVCEKVTTNDGTWKPEVTVIDNIVLDKPFIPEYHNSSSMEYQQLVQDAEEQISYYISLTNDTSIVGLIVTRVRVGSVILEVALLRNADATAQEVLTSLVTAIIYNRTDLVKSDEKSTSIKPKFLGISIQINDNVAPRIAVPVTATPTMTGEVGAADDDGDRTVLMSTIIPCMLILVLCFIVLVVIVQRRTRMHFYFARM